MKTFLKQTEDSFQVVAHPAGGNYKSSSAQNKRKARKMIIITTPSPDCFNVRGGQSKKGMNMRRTPAP